VSLTPGTPLIATCVVVSPDADDPPEPLPELELDAWRHLRDGRLEVGGRFAIGHANFLTFGGEMQSERDAAAGRAHDEGPHTASFTRATAASAETSPAPQKASAMRFSDQPSWWNV